MNKEDKGHNLLLRDLQEIWCDANEFNFKNMKYNIPKIELRKRLLDIAQFIIEGKYDN